jgi:hypothetical protein
VISGEGENTAPHLNQDARVLHQPIGYVLASENLDQVDAALPALEAALVDARLDVMLPEAGFGFGGVVVVVLGHQLDAHIPQLAPGQLERVAIADIDIEQAECDLGGQPREKTFQIMLRRREHRLALYRECAGGRWRRPWLRAHCLCLRRRCSLVVLLYVVTGKGK